MLRYNFTATALLLAILLCASTASVLAQQSDTSKSNQTYEAAVAKAQADCAALWANHDLDPLRDKVPLGEDNKPTPAMLANPDRVRAEDKPVVDLAIKALAECRKAWAPAWAMLPTAANLMREGAERKQDALIADFYSGKITWGEVNAEMDRLDGEFKQAISITQSPPTPANAATAETKSAKVSESSLPTNQNTPTPSTSNKPDATNSTDLQGALAKAQADCAALWTDPAFNALRGKLPLGEGATSPMLADPERWRSEDKQLGDLYVNTVKRCRTAYASAVAMLPPAAKAAIKIFSSSKMR
jgi:hypothetical protein